MELLIQKVTVADPRSDFNGQVVDLLIREGLIEAIGPELEDDRAELHDFSGAFVSPGWMDVGAWVPDPGFEQRETFVSAGRAAAAGGFTRVAVLPNAQPVVQGKREVQYVREANAGHPVAFLPMGASTLACEGKDITEMLDLHAAGAIAFTDGVHAIQHSGVMLRVLQYVRAMNGLVLQFPHDRTLAPGGQMHEGRISTELGMPGFPELSETLMVQRDLELLTYAGAGARLHLAGISCAASLELIGKARAEGLEVSCSVPALNLLYTDESLAGFDTRFKVMPPFRSPADREALRQGVLDGTIDLVISNHRPLEEEVKKLEFPYAEFGAIGLETVFPILREVYGEDATPDWLAEKLAHAPRRILGLEPLAIKAGGPAELTFFDPGRKRSFRKESFRSRSSNSPLQEVELPGQVLAVSNRGLFDRLSPE